MVIETDYQIMRSTTLLFLHRKLRILWGLVTAPFYLPFKLARSGRLVMESGRRFCLTRFSFSTVTSHNEKLLH